MVLWNTARFPETQNSVHFRGLCQESVAMKASAEKERENQGFETWSGSKKPKRKPISTKGVVPEKKSGKKDILEMTVHCPTLRSRSKHGSRPSRRSEAEGTVVITDKEYQLLLSFKERSTEVQKKNDLNGEGRDCNQF